jgi:hypothetical protein
MPFDFVEWILGEGISAKELIILICGHPNEMFIKTAKYPFFCLAG